MDERDVPFRLDGQRAVVTGASRGIGAAIAVALARAGADIIAVQRADACPQTQAAIEGWGQTCFPVGYDLSQVAGIPSLVEQIERDYGPVGILVNAAGMTHRHPPEDFPIKHWDEVMDVNLKATWLLCQGFGKRMLERDGGKIVNIASLLSFQGGITVPAYAASKGAVGQLTKALANDWAKRNVNVNAIAPGYIATDMNAALIANETRNRQILERIPADRWGNAEDIAGAAVFLASPAAAYINGHLLVVDGGWMGR
ncbi:MAG: SDR family oxidoreductase [Chloroflexota bacterium]|nr:SDR family oxidoreductase [Chloroflexota bacterium]